MGTKEDEKYCNMDGHETRINFHIKLTTNVVVIVTVLMLKAETLKTFSLHATFSFSCPRHNT